VDSDADLRLVPGQQPVVRVQVTNSTDAVAQLYGWIDYSMDGVFQTDPQLEESSIEVSAGYSGTVELVFPEVPDVRRDTLTHGSELAPMPRSAAPPVQLKMEKSRTTASPSWRTILATLQPTII
jgi:hypothetical protein